MVFFLSASGKSPSTAFSSVMLLFPLRLPINWTALLCIFFRDSMDRLFVDSQTVSKYSITGLRRLVFCSSLV